MSGELRLDAPRATAAGRDLSAAGKQLLSLRDGAVAAIVAAGRAQPWGTDDIGAAVQKNYGPALQQFVEAFGMIAAHVEGLGDAAMQSVTDNTAADSRAADTVSRAYRA